MTCLKSVTTGHSRTKHFRLSVYKMRKKKLIDYWIKKCRFLKLVSNGCTCNDFWSSAPIEVQIKCYNVSYIVSPVLEKCVCQITVAL